MLALSAWVSAQSIQREVVSTGGGSSVVSNYIVSFTIGEAVVGTYKPQNFIIVRGFQQGYDSVDYYHAATYAWASDNLSVTGTAVSTTNPDTKIEKTVGATYLVLEPATCERAGSGRYTSAGFNSRLFSVQEKDEAIAALGHRWDEGQVTTAATCVSAGVMTYTCGNDASHKRTEAIAIDASAHEWGPWTVKTYATETTTGVEERVCTRSSGHTETRVIPMLSHKHENNIHEVPAVAATCETAGNIKYYECTCGRKFSSAECTTEVSDVTVAALGHSWGEGVLNPAPTCTKAGIRTYTCQHDASHKKTESVAALGHSWDDGRPDPDHQPTCTEPGLRIYTCQHDASHVKTETIEAYGHRWPSVGDTTRHATCVIDGEVTFTCMRDRTHTYTEAIPAIGHSWDEGVETPATCTDSAYMTYTCRNDASHQYVEKTLAPLGHDWSDSTVTVVATCTTTGRMVVTCSRDASHKQTLTIPALGHDYVDEAVIAAATCTAAGRMQQVCLNDTAHKREVPLAIDPAAHLWGAWEPSGEGEERRVCEHNSSHVQTREVLPADHVHDLAFVAGEPATCLQSGTVSYYHCSLCGRDYADAGGSDEIRTYIAPATGHSWADGEVLVAATCETAGRMRQVCGNDNTHVREIMIAALGHSWDEGTVVTAATCEKAGEMLYTCRNNASHTNREVIPALGHDYDTVYVEATCETAGSETLICKRDASHTLVTVIPAIGHDWGAWDTTSYATQVSPGILKRECKNDRMHVETRTYEVAGEDGGTPLQGWTASIGTDGEVNLQEQEEGSSLQITIGGNGEPGTAEIVSPVISGQEGQYYDPDHLVPVTITFEARYTPSGEDSTMTISVLTGAGLENQAGNLQIVDAEGNPIVFESVVVDTGWQTYTLTGYIGPEGDTISLQFVTGTALGELEMGNISILIKDTPVATYFENTRDSGEQGGGEQGGGQGGEQGGQGGEQGGQGGEQGGQGGEEGGLHSGLADQATASEVRVYPNPATAQLFVELPRENATGVIKCFDNTGRLIMEKAFENTGKAELDVSGLPQGSYTLRIMIDETVTTKQVLKY